MADSGVMSGKPAPGTEIEFVWTKWDGGAHWVHECVYLGSDAHGDWFGQRPGHRSHRPGRDVVVEHANVSLMPPSGEWVLTMNADPHPTRVYTDIAWQAGWRAGVPTGIDMDLDVVDQHPRGVWLDDVDEWELHRERYGYPAEVIARLERVADELLDAVRGHAAPFDEETANRWLAALAAHGSQAATYTRSVTRDDETTESNRADLQKDPAAVSGMFDDVAAGYDLTNTVLSLGNDKLWRIAATRAIAPKPGQKILDLAAGTGASSVVLAKAGAEVVAADFSPGMIAEGRRRHGGVRGLSFTEADATALPFADDEFDTVTISFGLRNVVDPRAALAEMRRVTAPGGRIVICEFSHPSSPAFAGLYRFYNDKVLPVVAKAVSSNADAYDYLNESIRAWPDQATLASWMRDAGWVGVAHRDLTGGIVALHRGVKPSARAEAAAS